jgi:hypothetical protein
MGCFSYRRAGVQPLTRSREPAAKGYGHGNQVGVLAGVDSAHDVGDHGIRIEPPHDIGDRGAARINAAAGSCPRRPVPARAARRVRRQPCKAHVPRRHERAPGRGPSASDRACSPRVAVCSALPSGLEPQGQARATVQERVGICRVPGHQRDGAAVHAGLCGSLHHRLVRLSEHDRDAGRLAPRLGAQHSCFPISGRSGAGARLAGQQTTRSESAAIWHFPGFRSGLLIWPGRSRGGQSGCR